MSKKQDKSQDAIRGDLRHFTSNVGITTANIVEIDYHARMIVIKDYLSNRDKLKVLSNGKLMGSTVLAVLILIKSYPRSSLNQLLIYHNILSLRRSAVVLLDKGLIREIGKPRLIHPFQRFKVDKGYVITDKGEQVLREIIGG